MLSELRSFICQRPGLEFANYGDVSNYRADYRQILRCKHDAEEMLRFVELFTFSAQDLAEAAQRSFAGRLTWNEEQTRWEYVTGQYWPTEYRRAACSVLAHAIAQYLRNAATDKSWENVKQQARINLSKGIAKRWFN